jgi:protein SCO1
MTRIRTSALAVFVTIASAVVLGVAVSPAALTAQSRWGATYFPKVTLTTQDGEDVEFYDLIKGRIVAIDLIYTNCQYACPLETARLARAQQLLGDRMGRDIFFISISIDPTHDTPAVLKKYAAQYDAGPGWIFLTGKMDDIDLLSKKLGLWTDPKRSQDGHEPMLLIGNEATGQWTQTNALDNPAYTVRIIGEWMNSWKTAKPGRSYTEATPIKKRENGQYLYSSLCANCHTIGGGDRIGPDLAVAVKLREHDWMTRYIESPDVMRQKNDPIATALTKKFGDVRMPNLTLSTEEAAAIVAYVDGQAHAEHAQTSSAIAANLGPTAAAKPAATSGAAASAALIDPAIEIQVALAHDRVVGIHEPALALAREAAALGPSGSAIARAAGELSRQTDVSEARTTFGNVNEALETYLRDAGLSLPDGIRIAYCPMLRKSWLQREGAINNPYYGSKMLECGGFTNYSGQ